MDTAAHSSVYELDNAYAYSCSREYIGSGLDDSAPIALVLLNYACDIQFVKAVWKRASYVIAADGAASRLFQSFDNEAERTKYLPSYIVGDCDSVDMSTRCGSGSSHN